MLLLDTCSLLWLAADQSGLSKSARQHISAHSSELFVSAISALEIAIKHRRKKLVLPVSASKWYARALEVHNIQEIPISGLIAAYSAELPRHHDDPFDRIIIVTAELRDIPILTPDHLIKRYSTVETVF